MILQTESRNYAAPTRPSAQTIVVAIVTAACCVGFAAINVYFEVTDFSVGGPYAEYASGFTVMNWLVVVLKLCGAVAALWSVFGSPRGPVRWILGLTLWGAFATLAVYTLGSLGQAAAMLLGHIGGREQLDFDGIAYVLFFASVATGFGVLAISYARRMRLRAWIPVIGAAGGPMVLALVLVAVPAVLVALGIMPPL